MYLPDRSDEMRCSERWKKRLARSSRSRASKSTRSRSTQGLVGVHVHTAWGINEPH